HFMLWFKGNTTAQWAKENPDELVGFAKKSNSKSWHDYGGNPDVPSLASVKFLDQLSSELNEVAGFVLSKPWADGSSVPSSVTAVPVTEHLSAVCACRIPANG
ncbi:hypothetical protein RCJ22_38795, partial [Vibrio sp. FNV 38]|nr:hypothetical protein [Vibrio sp. FNV 38]